MDLAYKLFASLLVAERLELPLAADTRHDEVSFLILMDVAGGDELREQVDRCVTLRLLRLHHLDLCLEGIELHELGLCSLLF